MARSYSDWEKEAKESGLYNTFSDKDIEIIKGDTAYGDRMLGYKREYNSATTEAEKKAAADKANNERLQHGYYNTVGGDGKGGYRALSHTQPSASGTRSGGSNEVKNQGWQNVLNTMLTSYAADKFSYDAKKDPRYALAEEYADQAMKNQMAESAMLTGGYSNSYASSVGQQVYNSYMDEAASSLEAEAYNRWAAEHADKLNMIGLASQMEERDYNRTWNEALTSAEYGDFNALKALGVDTANAQMLYNNEKDYTLFTSALAKFNETGDISVFDGLGLSEASISGIAARYNSSKFAEEFMTAYQYYEATGNTDKLEAMNIDVTNIKNIKGQEEYARKLEQAILLATSVGDMSALEALNIDPSRLDKQWNLSLTPTYSGSRSSGSHSNSALEYSAEFERLLAAGAYDRTSAYNYLAGSGNYSAYVAKSIAALFEENCLRDINRHSEAIDAILTGDGTAEDVRRYVENLRGNIPDYIFNYLIDKYQLG